MRRVAVGGGQHHQDLIARLHGLARDDAILRDEAAGVVDRGIVARDFLDHALEQGVVAGDPAAELGLARQRQQRVADQARGRLVGLRHESDEIGQDGIAGRRARGRATARHAWQGRCSLRRHASRSSCSNDSAAWLLCAISSGPLSGDRQRTKSPISAAQRPAISSGSPIICATTRTGKAKLNRSSPWRCWTASVRARAAASRRAMAAICAASSAARHAPTAALACAWRWPVIHPHQVLEDLARRRAVDRRGHRLSRRPHADRLARQDLGDLAGAKRDPQAQPVLADRAGGRPARPRSRDRDRDERPPSAGSPGTAPLPRTMRAT